MVKAPAIVDVLRNVMDPEIPTANIVDLGMVGAVTSDGERIDIELLPTFLGCPAQPVIAEEVRAALAAAAPDCQVTVRFSNTPPWDSSRVSAEGWAALREYGISAGSTCPWCDSSDTEMTSAFGPAPCRTSHFCRSCRNVYEGFKTKQTARVSGVLRRKGKD